MRFAVILERASFIESESEALPSAQEIASKEIGISGHRVRGAIVIGPHYSRPFFDSDFRGVEGEVIHLYIHILGHIGLSRHYDGLF